MLQFDFSFEVPGKGFRRATGKFGDGLKLALLGPSGCGKSTFLKSLCGLGSRKEGSHVLWNGKDLNRAILSSGLLGFSFQNSPLFPHLTVKENLALPFATLEKFKNFAPSLQMERVTASLNKAGLNHLAERYPRDLSGGERKRISLLRSMIFEAPLLILDEPFSDLDSESRRLFKDWLSEITQNHKGVLIYVTHSDDDLSLSNAQMRWPESGDLNFGQLP